MWKSIVAVLFAVLMAVTACDGHESIAPPDDEVGILTITKVMEGTILGAEVCVVHTYYEDMWQEGAVWPDGQYHEGMWIEEQFLEPVEGVAVHGQFSFNIRPSQCITGEDGCCTMSSGTKRWARAQLPLSFTVTDLVHPDYGYSGDPCCNTIYF
jgi:hypothetical protein